MDIRWGYNNVRIHEGDEWKAAFVCKHGLFEPLVMYFGLTNSPATFQSMMNEIFRKEMLQQWLNGYMDDVLIGNEGDREDLTQKGIVVLDKMEENDLFVKPEKSEFFVTDVDFLGYRLKDGKLSMEDQKVSGIADWPPPENVSQLRSFFGFCNFYRRFIDHYADLCAPLNELLRKTIVWDWTPRRHESFEKIKATFVTGPVLLIPDYTKPFIIEADASMFTTGAILLQTDSNGEEHPTGYLSSSLNSAERNYQVYDRELLAIIRALREWRHYVQGSSFLTIIRTDHANLTYYRSPQRLTQRQTRWVIELMDYDVQLIHKPGKTMIPADALSRRHDHSIGIEIKEDIIGLPNNLFVRLIDLDLQDAVVAGQKEDTTAKSALLNLHDPADQPTKWQLEDGPNGSKCLFYDGRMYVPDDLDLRRRIVSDHHDAMVAGHLGALATTRSVRLYYWWPGMTAFIRTYVAGCATCQQFKVNTRPSKPSLYPIPSGSSRLFGAIGLDFMTDLPTADNGSDSIMVVVDHGLSKGVVLIPTTKIGLTAERTAELFLVHVYSRFGLPDSTLTNRGPQFESEFWQELCKSLGIKSKLTTAFHPQTNGGTERVNREIQLYLSIFCINNPSSWSQALKKAEFVHNNRPHADRSQSPFELMYGAAPKAIIEPYYKGNIDNQQRLTQLEQWRSDALLAHKYARQKMKERIKSTFTPFKKGDKVWLEGTNLKLGYNKKITTKREGPFTITEVLGPVNYRLKLPDKWRMRDNFHAGLLTPYTENTVYGENFPQPPPDLIEGDPEWEVERIIGHKGTKNIRYQVKWKGYDEMTWEHENNLQNSKESISDYWKRKKIQSRH
jgi:hypothetical protein